MYETRQRRRVREAEARRNTWTGYTGPWIRISDIDPDARINRPSHP